MELKFNKEDLENVLNMFSGISNGKVNPVLGSTLFEIKGNEAVLTSYNLEYGARATLLLTNLNTEEFSFLLDTVMLLNCIKKMKDEVKMVINDNNVKLSSGRIRYSLQSLDSEEFPELPKMENAKVIVSFPREEFEKGIRNTLYAVNNKPDVKKFLGLNIYTDKNNLFFRALDGYRTAEYSAEINYEGEPFSALLKQNIAKFILNATSKAENENITISKSGTLCLFEIGDFQIIARTMAGDNYDFKAFLPTDFKEIVVKSDALLEALEAVSTVIENSAKNPVRITGKKNLLQFESVSSLGKSSADCEVESSFEFEVGFNAKFLGDAVKYLDCEEITIKYSGAVSPAVVINNSNARQWSIVLPMRLKNN